jgi:hypothetical protein
MKFKIVFPLALLVIGCSTPDQKLIKEVESFLISSLNDPKSYDRISFNIKDTTTNLEFKIKSVESDKEHAEFLLNLELPTLQQEIELYKLTKDEYDLKNVKKDQAEVDSLRKVISVNNLKLEELKKTIEDGSIKFIYFHAQFRAKNGFGALIVNEKDIVYDYDTKEIQVYN